MRGCFRAGSLLLWGFITGQDPCYYEWVFQHRILLLWGEYFRTGSVTMRGVFQSSICYSGWYFRTGSVILCRVFQESISVTMRGSLRAGSLLRHGDISGQNLCYYEGYFRTGSVILWGGISGQDLFSWEGGVQVRRWWWVFRCCQGELWLYPKLVRGHQEVSSSPESSWAEPSAPSLWRSLTKVDKSSLF